MALPDKHEHFGLINDGQIEIVSLSPSDLEESVELLEAFFKNESVCIGSEINLEESTQAREELKQMCRIVAQDGVSLIAKNVADKKIVGVAFNKIQYVDESTEVSFFEEFRNKHCKSPNAINLMDFMITMDKEVDVFDLYKIDCVLEITFLCTLPEFGRRGIGQGLSKCSIELARELGKGVAVDGVNPILRTKRPKAVCALFTSRYSQKIGKDLGFKVLNKVSYSTISFNGKFFNQRIGPSHQHCEQVILLF